jgi:hypothetical protein
VSDTEERALTCRPPLNTALVSRPALVTGGDRSANRSSPDGRSSNVKSVVEVSAVDGSASDESTFDRSSAKGYADGGSFVEGTADGAPAVNWSDENRSTDESALLAGSSCFHAATLPRFLGGPAQ